tara:strand:+ start:1047 stop:1475 length:429 start_codon:yes stop_codon:yes gene_type:complete
MNHKCIWAKWGEEMYCEICGKSREQKQISIDELCNKMSKNDIQFNPREFLIRDLNHIMMEIIKTNNFRTIDIYNICVSCGSNLTWDQEYFINTDEYNWLKTHGYNYFYDNLLKYKTMTLPEQQEIYRAFTSLIQLFELQIGD